MGHVYVSGFTKWRIPFVMFGISSLSVISKRNALSQENTTPSLDPVIFRGTRSHIQLSSQVNNPIDKYILLNLMNGIKFQSTVVAFGCADGITNSNTWPLEQVGWHGLCIEEGEAVPTELLCWR
jgi:hypothetical protein